MQNQENINISKHVKEKLRKLHRDKLYDYSVFEPIPAKKKAAFRKAISRLAEEGALVKVGNGKFYKRGDRPFALNESLHIKPHRKDWLKSGKVPVGAIKYRLSNNLFWSNPKGKIPVENLIASVIEKGALDDLDFLRFSFGDDKVKEVFLKHFDIHSRPMAGRLLNV